MANKKIRLIDKQHLQYVASQPCMICGHRPVQAHHLLMPNTGFRGGVKAGDDDSVPLCFKHHAELHTKYGNEAKFFEAHGFLPDAGKVMARYLYNNKEDNDLPF